MTQFKVPFSGRGHCYTPAEIQAVVEAMSGTHGLTQGKYQDEFEREFASKFRLPNSFAVTSATSALELCALLCRIRAGDEVILPAHTFAASAIPFGKMGATLKWADIDPRYFVATAETIAPLITARTRAIVVVHLYGLTVPMDPVLALGKKHGIPVIEDAAQSIGGAWNGRPSGSMGDFGCFSFHSHKNITTLGEGGMLTVRDPALAQTVPGFRHNGVRAFEGTRESYWKPAMSNVDFDWDGVWPHNFCLSEPQCALGTRLLGRLDEMNRERGERAAQFKNALADFPELEFQQIPPGTAPTFHLLVARFRGTRSTESRDHFMRTLAEEYRIQTVVQYYPLYRYPLFRKAGFGEAACPETDAFFDNMISFPFQHWLAQDQLDYMIESTRKTLHSLRAQGESAHA